MVRFPDRRAASQRCPISPDRRLILGRVATWGSVTLAGAVAGPFALASGLRPIDVARASFVGLAATSEGILACGERGLIARRDTGDSQWRTLRVGSTRSFTAIAARMFGFALFASKLNNKEEVGYIFS